MIHEVLASLHIYFLSLYKIPNKVSLHIEKLMRDILWENLEDSKGINLVKWDVVSNSNDKVGLGIGNVEKKNKVLCKCLWKFPLERNPYGMLS